MDVTEQKFALITGCSTGGIGWAMAKRLHQHGFYVFATARDTSKISDIDSKNTELLELDVTVPSTIERCRGLVSRRTGGRLDVLVNNAGVEFNSPLLDTNVAEAKKLYEVNVWGPLLMVQAFAPLLIEAKGVIFNQSSIDSALNMVWAGIFASSKSALTRISETMHSELRPLGVGVITSICGSVDTPMFAKPGGRMTPAETSYFYGVEEAAWDERMGHQRQASKVDVIAEQLVRAIIRRSDTTVWNGAFSTLVWWASLLHMTWVVDKLINSQRGLKSLWR